MKNIHFEHWLIQSEGEGRFGPFYEISDAYACIIAEKLSDYELKTFLSYLPF